VIANDAGKQGGWQEKIRARFSFQIDDALLVNVSANSYAHCIYGGLDTRRIDNMLFTHSHSDQDVHLDIAVHMLDLWKYVSIEPYQVACRKPDMTRNETCFLYVVKRDGKTLLIGYDSAMFEEETWAARLQISLRHSGRYLCNGAGILTSGKTI